MARTATYLHQTSVHILVLHFPQHFEGFHRLCERVCSWSESCSPSDYWNQRSYTVLINNCIPELILGKLLDTSTTTTTWATANIRSACSQRCILTLSRQVLPQKISSRKCDGSFHQSSVSSPNSKPWVVCPTAKEIKMTFQKSITGHEDKENLSS